MFVLTSISMFIYGEASRLPDFIESIFVQIENDSLLPSLLFGVTLIFLLKNLINFYIPNLSADIGSYLFQNTLSSVLSLQSRESESRKKYLSSLELINHFTTYCRALLLLLVHSFILVSLFPFIFFFLKGDSLIPLFLLIVFFGLVSLAAKKFISIRSKLIAQSVGPRASLFSKNIEGNNEIVLNNFSDFYVNKTSAIDLKVRKASRDNDFFTTIPRTSLDFLFLIFIIIFFSKDGSQETSTEIITILVIAQRLMPHLQQIFIQYGRIKANSFQSRKLFKFFPLIFDPVSKINLSDSKFSSINQIEFNSVFKKLDEKEISIPDFILDEKKVLLVLGESGSGKTTFLDILSGIDKEFNGQTLINNQNLQQLDQNYFAKTVFYLRQDAVILFDNVLDFMERFEIEERISSKLGINNLEITQPLEELSGGQIQRLYLSAALSSKKTLILLDEPTKGLNIDWLENLSNLIQQSSDSKKIVICTHDENFKSLLKVKCEKDLLTINMKKND